jgi:uncharacterized cupredoxin-like copper-binding protein
MSRPVAVLLVLVMALAASACTRQEPEITTREQVPAAAREPEPGEEPADGGAPAGETYRFVAIDIDYSEAPSTVAAGNVTFELVNEGNLPHDVTIEEIGNVVVVHADGGQTESGNVTLDPGSYVYYCSIPGHRAAGMEGELTVQ